MAKTLFYFSTILIITVLLFAGRVSAYETGNGFLCVDGSGSVSLAADFQAALDAVSSAYTDVRLISGNFLMPSLPTGHFGITVGYSLTISGGWNEGCSSKNTRRPDLTILTGGTKQTVQGGVLAITVEDNSLAAVAVSNLTIKNGRSGESGGGFSFLHTNTLGITALRVTLNLSDIITENNATDGSGSGIYIADNNTDGGTIVNISACQVLDNSSLDNGGGVYIQTGLGDITLVNNIFAGNTVANGNGGGAFISGGGGANITLTNNTITANTAENNNGGGIFLTLTDGSSQLNIYNNIIYNNNNVAGGSGEDLYIENPNGNTVNIYNTDFNSVENAGFYISNNTKLNNIDNINANPEFEDVGNNNFHLKDSSPAINAGNNSALHLPDYDIDGSERVQDGTVDMGAYESTTSSTVIGGEGCFIATAADGNTGR